MVLYLFVVTTYVVNENPVYNHTYYVITDVRRGWIGDHSKTLHRHAVEVEQMIACLLAEIRTIQERRDANHRNGRQAEGNKRRQSERQSKGSERRNESRPRTPDIRNAGRVTCPSRKDDVQDGLPSRENGGLSRKDGGHGF
jgi:hypothetical protein